MLHFEIPMAGWDPHKVVLGVLLNRFRQHNASKDYGVDDFEKSRSAELSESPSMRQVVPWAGQ